MFEFTQLGVEVYIALAIAALVTGFVDAVVGGGGMILLPSLFAMLPNAAPSLLLGTNKFAGIFGTAIAARQFLKKVTPPWPLVLIAAIAAGLASIFGAASVQFIPTLWFKRLLPFVLFALLLYTLWDKNFGIKQKKIEINLKTKSLAFVFGATLGFYDGVFGPGTGSLLVFLWVRLFGLTFLAASASAKVVNLACNAGALLFFLPAKSILFTLAVCLAFFTMIGAMLGSRFAIRYGASAVRKMFIFIVVALIVRTVYDVYIA